MNGNADDPLPPSVSADLPAQAAPAGRFVPLPRRLFGLRLLGAVPLAIAAAAAAQPQTAQAGTDGDWTLTGNSLPDSTKFLGTTNAQALTIKTDNATRLTVTSSGRVGVGTTAPATKLHVVTSITAVRGEATASSGTVYGVHGKSASSGGSGVFGETTASSGSTYGVHGKSTSTSGRGVFGEATATSGSSTSGVYGKSASSEGDGVFGEATASSGPAYGVYGISASSDGRGVVGQAKASSGATIGVHGSASSPDGKGVRGEVTSSSGPTYGVYGTSVSSSGRGVFGYAAASSGATIGVVGSSISSSGKGVFGEVTATSGNTYGVHGRSASSSGSGVFGEATASSGAASGVYGKTASSDSDGVFGEATATSGTTYGVYGTSASTSGRGVVGYAAATSGATRGVAGSSISPDGEGVAGFGGYAGVLGESSSNGVIGRATSGVGIGVVGTSPNIGVQGFGTGESGIGVVGIAHEGTAPKAVYGITESPSPYALAGFFVGNVDVLGTLSKSAGSFKIDHPLDPANHYLAHSFVESPDMLNVYNGNVTLGAGGSAVVKLPAYFAALNRDFRYQLTAIGAPAPNLHVADKIANNRFTIAGGAAGMEVSWQVTGVRDDAYARAHPIVVEQPKPAHERGTYLTPKEHGQPVTKHVQYERNQKLRDSAQERVSPGREPAR